MRLDVVNAYSSATAYDHHAASSSGSEEPLLLGNNELTSVREVGFRTGKSLMDTSAAVPMMKATSSVSETSLASNYVKDPFLKKQPVKLNFVQPGVTESLSKKRKTELLESESTNSTEQDIPKNSSAGKY